MASNVGASHQPKPHRLPLGIVGSPQVVRAAIGPLARSAPGAYKVNAFSSPALANLLFTLELQRRLTDAGDGVRAIAAHPGGARTSLANQTRGLSGAFSWHVDSLGPLSKDAGRGAVPIEYAATQDVPRGSLVGPNGLAHMRGCYPEIHRPSKAASDPGIARRLSELSTTLTRSPTSPRSPAPA